MRTNTLWKCTQCGYPGYYRDEPRETAEGFRCHQCAALLTCIEYNPSSMIEKSESKPDKPSGTILQTAQDLIYGDREKDYGDAAKSFGKVATMWTEILSAKVTAEQVCLCMVALKMARLIHQPSHRDSVIDGAGYFGCYEKVLKVS